MNITSLSRTMELGLRTATTIKSLACLNDYFTHNYCGRTLSRRSGKARITPFIIYMEIYHTVHQELVHILTIDNKRLDDEILR